MKPQAPQSYATGSVHGTGTGRVLRAQGIEVAFKAGGDAVRRALGGVDLDVFDSECLAVVGVSSCGKSTLLSVLAGLIPPTTGNVLYEGKLVSSPNPKLGIVFQSSTLFPWLTVIGNVQSGCRMRALEKKMRDKEANDLLEALGLAEFGSYYPHQLSGGMAQRVEIARAIANQPHVLLLDEPFAALDALTRASVQQWFANAMNRFKITSVLITHSIEEALILSDRIAVMTPSPGRIRRLLEVPFSHPRKHQIVETQEFTALRRQIEDLLPADPSAFSPPQSL